MTKSVVQIALLTPNVTLAIPPAVAPVDAKNTPKPKNKTGKEQSNASKGVAAVPKIAGGGNAAAGRKLPGPKPGISATPIPGPVCKATDAAWTGGPGNTVNTTAQDDTAAWTDVCPETWDPAAKAGRSAFRTRASKALGRKLGQVAWDENVRERGDDGRDR